MVQQINETDYRQWLGAVDGAICEVYGEGKESLPEIVNFRSMFSRGLNPAEAASEALKQCGLDMDTFKSIFSE